MEPTRSKLNFHNTKTIFAFFFFTFLTFAYALMCKTTGSLFQIIAMTFFAYKHLQGKKQFHLRRFLLKQWKISFLKSHPWIHVCLNILCDKTNSIKHFCCMVQPYSGIANTCLKDSYIHLHKWILHDIVEGKKLKYNTW